jgi:hypothetical protein
MVPLFVTLYCQCPSPSYMSQSNICDYYSDHNQKQMLTASYLPVHLFSTYVRHVLCADRNAQNTFLRLLELGIVPIVNENDTVSVDELRFGDNDTLSALVASLITADWLFLLTDVEVCHHEQFIRVVCFLCIISECLPYNTFSFLCFNFS